MIENDGSLQPVSKTVFDFYDSNKHAPTPKQKTKYKEGKDYFINSSDIKVIKDDFNKYFDKQIKSLVHTIMLHDSPHETMHDKKK